MSNSNTHLPFGFFYRLQCSVCSVEKVNLVKLEGRVKIGGTAVCIFGAFLMVAYKGPIFAGGTSSFHQIIPKSQPQPIGGWMESRLLGGFAGGWGIEQWHAGVLCLIANCFCMASYLTLQVVNY